MTAPADLLAARRRRSAAKTALRLARVAVAALLVAAVSGAPRVVSAALADDCCAEQCESQRDGGDCAPNCPSPSCAKVSPTALPQSRSDGVVAVGRPDPALAGVAAPVLPLVVGGVFHPPRA